MGPTPVTASALLIGAGAEATTTDFRGIDAEAGRTPFTFESSALTRIEI
jgi:hypothetical protein